MNYYKINFTMAFDYNKDIGFFDNVIPFERDIYLDMLINKLRNTNTNDMASNQEPPRREEFE